MPGELYYSHRSEKASIYAHLDDSGEISFAVRAAPDSPVRGAELFRRMVAAFGDDVTAIRGVWIKGTEPSINIDKVNELTALGIDLNNAILETWTVKQAAKAGFDAPSVVACVGNAGQYTQVVVLIKKSGE